MNNSYIFVDSGISMVIGGAPYLVDRSHVNFQAILDALKEKNWGDIPDLVNIAKSVKSFVTDNKATRIGVHVEAGIVTYDDEEIHGSLVDRILAMMAEGFSVDPLVAFLENLMQNPSKRAVDSLYDFLVVGKLPITEDGHFLAYKRVREDFLDFFSRTFDNSVGNTVEMPRNKVDEDPDRTCSFGLHICSLEYLPHYQSGLGRALIVKVNPANVVAIPRDYNNTKARVCKYEVIGEYRGSETVPAFNKSVFLVEKNDNPDLIFPEAEVDHYEQGFIGGYVMGFDDGKYKNQMYVDADSAEDRWDEGYIKGYKDGRGKKKRLYTADDVN